MFPSLKEIRDSYPRGKWEPLWTRCFLRPLSFPAAWVAVRLGFSANKISQLSLFVSMLAAALMSTGMRTNAIIGALFFNLFALMDCVDGHVARVKKQASVYGGWMDALGGYVAYSCVLLAGGIAAEALKGRGSFYSDSINFIVIGAIAAITNLLMRLLYNHFRCLQGQNAVEKIRSQKKIGATMGVTGFLMPAVLAGVLLNLLHWVLLLYCVFYFCGCVAVTLRLIHIVQGIQNELFRQQAKENSGGI